MAIDPLTGGLLVLLGYGLVSHSRHKRKIRMTGTSGVTPPAKIPKTPLMIAPDCSSWEMPETWIIQTAQPRFRKRLDEILQTTKGDLDAAKDQALLDPVLLTYKLLQGEIGSCPEPLLLAEDGTPLSFRELQSDIPQHPDYYPHAAILGLYDSIYEAVETALSVLELTGDPGRALLFPL